MEELLRKLEAAKQVKNEVLIKQLESQIEALKEAKENAPKTGLRPSEEALSQPRQVTIFPSQLEEGKKGKAYQVTVGSPNGKGISIDRVAPRLPKKIREANKKELKHIRNTLGLTSLVDE